MKKIAEIVGEDIKSIINIGRHIYVATEKHIYLLHEGAGPSEMNQLVPLEVSPVIEVWNPGFQVRVDNPTEPKVD